MKPILKEKLSEQAYRIIRDMITNCRFLPGSRLNIEQLARDMEVSRTPLWEAVNRLIQEGLLLSVPNRGVFVADITPEAALEIYTVRESLEGLAARLAAANVHPEAVARMETSLARQYEMAETQDLIGYSRYDFEFHDVIYELSKNKFLQELLDFVRARTRPTLMDFIPLLKTSYEDHCAILESLKAGDGTRTEKTIRAHIRRICRQLRKTVAKTRKKSE
jgi:DNA-binding GntR family transcriptional regulator